MLTKGFTLLEMAIVVAVMMLLVSLLLQPLSQQVDQQRIEITKIRLQEAREALLGYVVQKGYLPCPDVGTQISGSTGKIGIAFDGKEDRNKPNETPPSIYCVQIDGYLPWQDLGLESFDGWGNRMRYRIDRQYNDFPLPPYPPRSEGGVKRIQITDNAGADLSSDESSPLFGTRTIVVIFSCGKNGRADLNNGHTTDNLTNCPIPHLNEEYTVTTAEGNGLDVHSSYIQDAYIENKTDPTKTFDDILITLSKNEILLALIRAGKYPPSP